MNKKQTNESFIINNNIIYYNFIKNKRITQSVLILKVYNIVISINITYTILTTLDLIIK
ncbi:aurora kinase 2 splicing [Colletotrichum filicis]|nr:aurora kinase 2 splicing [Colletotrichum filicis]